MATSSQLKTAWVAGTIHLMPAQTRLWHTVCDKCKKTVNLPVGSDLTSMFSKKDMNVEPRCHVHVYLNDPSGTLPAALFATTAENLIGYTAREVIEAAEKNAPLNDEIAKKIDKKQVLCFLKDYDRSYDIKFERSFPAVKLYTEEEVASRRAHALSSLVAATVESDTTEDASIAAEKENQMFSPSTKKVVDEIANKVGVVKRGITFNESSSQTEAIVIAKKVLSPSHEEAAPGSTSGNPIKKDEEFGSS